MLHNHNTQLIRAYYEEKMNGYEHIKKLIEAKLLNESGKRLILPLVSFVDHNEEVQNKVIEITDSTGILRISGRGERSEIEIVHDRLANEIKASRTERQNRELNAEAQRKNDEAEELQRKARKNEEEAKDFRKRAQSAKRSTFIVIGLAIVIIGAVFIWAFHKSQTIIQDAQDNYTVLGLQEQLRTRDSAILSIRDSLGYLTSSGNINLSSGQKNYLDSFNKKQTEYDSLRSAYLSISDKVDQLTDENNDLNIKLSQQKNNQSYLNETNKEHESLNTPPDVKGDSSLQPSDIIVTEFCPLGKKSKDSIYFLKSDEFVELAISLKFRVNNLAERKIDDKIHIKITYPPGQPLDFYKGYNRVEHFEAFSVFKTDIHRKFARGKYGYEIFYKGNPLGKGSFNLEIE